MNKTSLVARHEFLNSVRRKSFLIITLAFPLVALLLILAAQIIPRMVPSSTETERIGYIDNSGLITESAAAGNTELVSFDSEDAANAALLGKSITEYVVIPADYISTGRVQRYSLRNEMEPRESAQSAIRDLLLNNLLKGTDSAIVERAKTPLRLVSVTLTSEGEVSPRQGGWIALILPYIFSIALMMSIFFSSGYLFQGLAEEKENRVMEIVLSSVSPRQLLAGKVIGLGAAGLAQISIWLFTGTLLAGMASQTFSSILGALYVPREFLVLGSYTSSSVTRCWPYSWQPWAPSVPRRGKGSSYPACSWYP